MKERQFLETYQPKFLTYLKNVIKNDRLGQGYLLCGGIGCPLKEAALFLSETLICLNPDPLGCETCRACERFQNNNYQDFIFIDGSTSTIKKEQVQEIIQKFSKSPLEEKGVKVYVIHHAENMTAEAVNSLLKFLEEPPSGTYAILTTNNRDRILPTILSRVETINLALIPVSEVKREALELGVKEDDAELLSTIENSPAAIKEESENEDYVKAKKALKVALNAFTLDKDDAIFRLEKEIIPLVNNKNAAKYFFKLLTVVFKDLAVQERSERVLKSYDKLLEPIEGKITSLGDALYLALHLESELELNINPTLLLEKLFQEIL